MLDEVGTISERTATQAGDAAAAAEQQTASLTNVTDGIESLSGRATELRDLLDTFEVSEADATGPADPHAETGGQAAADGGFEE